MMLERSIEFGERRHFPTSSNLSNFARFFPTSLGYFQIRWVFLWVLSNFKLTNFLFFPTPLSNFTYPANNRVSKWILFLSYVSRLTILQFVAPYDNTKSKNSILLSDERIEFEVSWRCTGEGVSNIQAPSILNDVPMMTSSWIFKFPDSRWLSTVILETIDLEIAK